MKSSVSGIFEVVWFILGGLMLFIAVDSTLDQGLAASWFYFLLSILAFLLYLLRRKMRISRR